MILSSQSEAILAAISESQNRGFALRQEAMAELDNLPAYDWSGIYRLDGDMLVLDAFVGAPTEHDRIPVGVGVCGTAVALQANQVIEDVRELDNYLACSVKTRSEAVVLIHALDGSILGQIDIDSHEVGAFDSSDEQFLLKLGALLAKRWE